jgi:antitoxin VapB
MTRPDTARKVSIFRNNRNQAIRLPKDFEFQGVTELTIERQGDTILLRPVRPDWLSLMEEPPADADFLNERPDLIEEGRFSLNEERKHKRRGVPEARQGKK